jgi:ppGpp synthetase/RelA/SpoT-type nucleotidyltranferase
MAWSQCQYSRRKIDEAGAQLIALPPGDPDRDDALEIINNWRSCHGYPLHIIYKTVRERAKRELRSNALVARRIKRLPSIALKLSHNADMKLSQMQDIGGCRAVLNNVVQVEKLVGVYEKAKAKHPDPTDRPFLWKQYDYVKEPKPDGYRGVHLIMKYQSAAKPEFSGQRIEIQVRSQLQHAWATSVETCQAFTGQALKSKIKSASEEWLRFFALMSSAIAAREKRPLVPGTPTSAAERKRELTQLEKDQQVIFLLQGWNSAMRHPTIADDHTSAAFLLELNTQKRTLTTHTFKQSDLPFAHARYLKREKETEGDPSVQVVLVSADSLANLRRAYPNFYVDTTAFIRAITQEIY